MDFEFAPPPARRYPKESDCGSVKTRGLSAVAVRTSPAPWTSTEASCVRLVSAKAGPAVDISADFICGAVQVGWRWVRSAATPATCGAEKLVPSRTAYASRSDWPPANSGSVDERIWAPGAVTSGLRACPNGVSPDDVKLVGTPAHVVGTSVMSLVKRTVTAPPA